MGLTLFLLHGLANQKQESVTSWFLSFLPTQRGEDRHRKQDCFQNRKHMHLARKRTAATDGRSLPAEGTGQ